jgi:hypothetical protein
VPRRGETFPPGAKERRRDCLSSDDFTKYRPNFAKGVATVMRVTPRLRILSNSLAAIQTKGKTTERW